MGCTTINATKVDEEILPIVQNEKLIEIITEKDIIKVVANNRSMLCEIQDKLPTSAASVIVRLREVTFSESFFHIQWNYKTCC
jgi:hypothetical protein